MKKWKVKITGCYSTCFIFDKYSEASDFIKTALESCRNEDKECGAEIELIEEEEDGEH